MRQSKLVISGKIAAGVFAIIALTLTFVFVFLQKDSAAAPVTDFKPGRIIEDSVFTNSTSMTPQQIQSFLNSKVPACDTNGLQRSEMNNSGVPDYNGNGSIQRWEWGRAKYNQTTFPCLKDYTEGGRVAAQIIYDVSQSFAINPQVLIVLLQKEQSLVTDTWPSVIQYRSATGYGCPDTAACDSQYYGLTNQLTWAARMFRSILNNSPGWYTPYNLGNNFIRWSPTSSCGGSTVNIENRSTQALYNYTPYQPNASALAAGYVMGDACGAYGNRNFYLYFRDWFGYNAGPAAFKTADSGTVYVPVEGYKMAVPSMALLNDYGISSSSIQVVNQQYIDARPTAPVNTGISSSISYVVKSPSDTDEDGGSVYLISRGKRYQIQSMQQFFNFGFQENQISYLPLGYIFSMPNGGFLQNYISAPSSEVFKVDASGKHLFFDYPTYIKDNPSDQVSAFSYNLIDQLTSGNPITDGPTLVKYANSSAVYLYQNNTFYLAPDYITFSQCWGLDNHLNMVVNSPSQNSYIKNIESTSQLSCQINDGTNNVLLNGNVKYVIPASSGITSQSVNSDLQALSSKIPTRQKSLSAFVKTTDNASVWFVDDGKRYLIPTYANLVALGASDADIDTINSNTLYSLTDAGIKLGNGSLVKTNSSGAVYVIRNNERLLFQTSELFNAYGASWNNIESYSQLTLDAQYPFNNKSLSEYIANPSTGKSYIVAQNSCYELTGPTYAALGVSYAQIANTNPYGDVLFKSRLGACAAPASRFIKSQSSSLVYYLNAGKKQPISSYSTMVSLNGGTSPSIMIVSIPFIESIQTGTSL